MSAHFTESEILGFQQFNNITITFLNKFALWQENLKQIPHGTMPILDISVVIYVRAIF